MPALFDRLIVDDEKDPLKRRIRVLDEHGIQVVYREALNDLLLLEEELVKAGSHYLNKAELDRHLTQRNHPSSMLDRAEVCLHLFENEVAYQMKKVSIVEEYLKAYEHVCDPLEALRLLQIIVDTMAMRPRLNLDASYFLDSYKCEIDALSERYELVSEVFRFQKDLEKKKNDEARKF